MIVSDLSDANFGRNASEFRLNNLAHNEAAGEVI